MFAQGINLTEGGAVTFNFERTVDDKTGLERGPGLLAPFTSEIHGGLRAHGASIPELLDSQLKEFNGGCPPNTCENVQVAPNLPPTGPLPAFVATSLDATSTGFVAEFSANLDLGSLNLFDTEQSQLGPSDVVVEGAAVGPVDGSLVVDSTLRKVTFVKSDGILAADTYTVTLRTETDGFTSAGGRPLESNSGAIGVSGLGTTFTVSEPNADTVIVGLPDFVRGPGQDVNLPAEGADIPLSISEGTNVTTINLQVSYDPALLEFTGATVGEEMPAGASVIVDTSTPGLLVLEIQSGTALPAGSGNFVNLQATVPAEDPDGIYAKQHLLDIHSVTNSLRQTCLCDLESRRPVDSDVLGGRRGAALRSNALGFYDRFRQRGWLQGRRHRLAPATVITQSRKGAKPQSRTAAQRGTANRWVTRMRDVQGTSRLSTVAHSKL